jgi:hypothetical protein
MATGIRDLVTRAASDKDFAAKLLANPASVAGEYNLTSDQVSTIKEMADQGLFRAPVEAHSATPAYY